MLKIWQCLTKSDKSDNVWQNPTNSENLAISVKIRNYPGNLALTDKNCHHQHYTSTITITPPASPSHSHHHHYMCGQPCMIQWIVHFWLATRTCWVMSKYLSARTVASDEDVIKAKKMKSITDFTSQLKREVENLQNQHVRDQESFLDLKRKQWVEMETLKMKHNQMLLDATGVEEDAISVKTRISRDHVCS